MCATTQWGIHDQTKPGSNNRYEKWDHFPNIKATSKIPKPQTRQKIMYPTDGGVRSAPHDSRAEQQTLTAWARAAAPVSPTDQ